MVYGGGPAIVGTKQYFMHEAHEDPKAKKLIEDLERKRKKQDSETESAEEPQK